MSEQPGEREPGEWHVRIGADMPEGEAMVLDRENRPVATVHGTSFEEVFRRARLIARAPGLRDAVRGSYNLFKLMAQNGPGPCQDAAGEMLPMRESVMWNIVEEHGGLASSG